MAFYVKYDRGKELVKERAMRYAMMSLRDIYVKLQKQEEGIVWGVGTW